MEGWRQAAARAAVSVEALARELAAAPPDAVARFMASLDAAEQEAVEAAMGLLRREQVADLAARFPTMPPGEAAELLAGMDAETVELLQAEMDVRDLDAFIAGREQEQVRADAEVDGPTWMASFFPRYATAGFAPHMVELWEWVWQIRRGVRSRPFVGAWFRGGSKSTSAEAATAALGARGRRGYGLYISGIQDQADKHVQTLGAMLESPRFAAAYPDMARRAVTKYGAARGWSRTRLHTASGFVVDALGLSVEARGIKIEEARPDFIVLDDVDALTDGPAAVQKKVELLTQTILPAGSQDVVVLAIQNVLHPNSIFARLCGVADQPADWLVDRIVSGPVPAVRDLDVQPEPHPDDPTATRWTVKGGEPTWEGYPLAAAQDAIDLYGYTSFMRECQHEVEARPGGMFDHLAFRRCRPDQVPFLVRRVCWMDPAVTDGDGSDSQGIQVDGIDGHGQVYRLWSWEARTSPQRALCLAVRSAVLFGCGYVGVETDQGGDTWRSVFAEACATVSTPDPQNAEVAADGGELVAAARLPGFRSDKAGAGHGPKFERAARMLVEYEGPRAPIHVEGPHAVLEAALRRFGPQGTKPFDLVDAGYYSWHDLRRGGRATLTVPGGPGPRPPINPAQGPAGQQAPRPRPGAATVSAPGRRLGRATRSR